MYAMFVTLDVSKLNDWLKADAIWQVERKKHRKEGRRAGRVAGGRAEAATAQAACREGPAAEAMDRARAERT